MFIEFHLKKLRFHKLAIKDITNITEVIFKINWIGKDKCLHTKSRKLPKQSVVLYLSQAFDATAVPLLLSEC